MPYFVYRILSPKNLEYVDVKTGYQDAKALVRGLRAEQSADDNATIRMVFAKTSGEAEKLLSELRAVHKEAPEEKFIVFSEYVDTVDWLIEFLPNQFNQPIQLNQQFTSGFCPPTSDLSRPSTSVFHPFFFFL